MVSYRGNRVNWRIVAAVAALILTGANPPSPNSTGKTTVEQANKRANQDKTVTPDISSINEALAAQHAKTDPYEKERNKREIRDLAAQEKSAYWAEYLFWATVAALVLSLIGIGLVWTTFRETKQSNDIARDHQRARLLPSAELMRTNHLSETMKVALRCENIGLSPAYRVRCFALPVKSVPEMPPTDASGGFERTMTVGATDDLVEVGNFESDYYVVGMIQYDTIFGGPKYSYFCFCFVWSRPSRKWFAVSQIPKTWPRDT